MTSHPDLGACDPDESLEDCLARVRRDPRISHEMRLWASIMSRFRARYEERSDAIAAQLAATDHRLADHISREDKLAAAHATLATIVAEHNSEADRVWKPMIARIEGHMERVDVALYGEEGPDGSRTDGLINMRRWLCRVAQAGAWLAGAVGAIIGVVIAVGHAAGWW